MIKLRQVDVLGRKKDELLVASALLLDDFADGRANQACTTSYQYDCFTHCDAADDDDSFFSLFYRFKEQMTTTKITIEKPSHRTQIKTLCISNAIFPCCLY